jgi:electron transfer flavoprotein beta subunit
MRILVCVKRVPAPGARIVLTEDRRAIDSNLLSFTVSPHEECAVEEAVRIAEQSTGDVTVLTLGPAESEEQLRSAVAVGAHHAVLIPTEGDDWDPMSTAAAIASAVEDLEDEGRFGLILFGNESADSGGYQVGVRVAHALGRPMVTGIKGIGLEDGMVRLRRDTATGSETYRLPLPAVVSVKEGINLPRYPTLKGRLEAKKTELRVVEKERTGSGQTMSRLVSPPQVASETTILPDAAAVVDLLEQLQVVR